MTMARPSKAGAGGVATAALGVLGAAPRRGFGAVSGSALGDSLVEALVEGFVDGLAEGLGAARPLFRPAAEGFDVFMDP